MLKGPDVTVAENAEQCIEDAAYTSAKTHVRCVNIARILREKVNNWQRFSPANNFRAILGRAPSFAAGIKIANPDLSVWIIMGDEERLGNGLRLDSD